MTETAYIFPGQGSQYVGMGRDLYDSFESVKKIFSLADEVIGFPLTRLCFEGPEGDLRLTINAQPALVITSYACLLAAREVSPNGLPSPAFMAGHSLGEYTALLAAGVFDFSTAVRLARQRGKLMYEAGLARPGSMTAVLGLDEAALSSACAEGGTWIANINCPGQLVVSGEREWVDKTAELARGKGAGRTVPLQVSGAFHTPLMQPAADGMAAYIADLSLAKPSVPVIGNVTAAPLTETQSIKDELLRQLCHCVQWQRSVEYMLGQGVSTFIEIGPGKVLAGLVRRISKEARTMNIGDLAAVNSLGK